MREPSLFDFAVRSTDPETSKMAESAITKDGTRSRACEVAYGLVVETPGLTANEYEASIGVQDGRIRKRLNDLLKAGLVRKGPVRASTVSGKQNETWFPA
jgi:predicted HTH transcriptional regulator